MDSDVSLLCDRLAAAAESAGFVIIDQGADWLEVERERGFFVPGAHGLVKPTWTCRVRVVAAADQKLVIVLSRLSHMPATLVRTMSVGGLLLAGLAAAGGIYSLAVGHFVSFAISAVAAMLFALVGRYSHLLRVAPFEMIANRHALALLIGAISSESDAPLSIDSGG